MPKLHQNGQNGALGLHWGTCGGPLGVPGSPWGLPGDPWGGFWWPFGAECGTVLEFEGWAWASSGPFLVQNAEL